MFMTTITFSVSLLCPSYDDDALNPECSTYGKKISNILLLPLASVVYLYE